MITRAKFYCESELRRTAEPYKVDRYQPAEGEPTSRMAWPRQYSFRAVYDSSTPENARFTAATPSGTVTLDVDNAEVSFVPGKHYYLDFTPIDEEVTL